MDYDIDWYDPDNTLTEARSLMRFRSQQTQKEQQTLIARNPQY